MKYNHAFDIAFSLESDHETGDDVTPQMLSSALRKRANDLDRNPMEWLEATGTPFDTYEIEP